MQPPAPAPGPIRLVYAANTLVERDDLAEQHLYFLAQVDNLAFAKEVDVVWTGADGVRHALPAHFHGMLSPHSELWNATVVLTTADTLPLPRHVHFSLRYRVDGKTYRDDNGGAGHFVPLGAALQGPAGASGTGGALDLGHCGQLPPEQRIVPVTLAVNAPVRATGVTVRWTTDDWAHVHATPCELVDRLVLDTAGQLVDAGSRLWGARLQIGAAFRLKYCFQVETDTGTFWVNNGGNDHIVSRKPLNVLVLNLHCFQEDDQLEKFDRIRRAIAELCVDVVCLQEVAENWNDGHGDWASNAVRILNDGLPEPFHVHTDWAHLGFDRYREGLAILSRYPFVETGSRHLSESRDPYSISTRKGILGRIPVPHFGTIDVFCVHLSWWSDHFAHQFRTLHDWVETKATETVQGTLVCGDFNNPAGGIGYELIVDTERYDDVYLAMTEPHAFPRIFRDREAHWQRHLADTGRIDYVFQTRTSALRATAARFIFNAREYGPVSDHEGLFVSFEPA